MTLYIAEKLKALRAERGISQEKLAQYLGVSYQAVSKWETAAAYPDITLLPEIARYFDITVDELLQVEQIDERALYADYEKRAYALWRDTRDREALISLWQEALHKMPCSAAVKEMLLSAYFDADRVKYQKEIVELGTELYQASLTPDGDNARQRSMHMCAYYRGQAVCQMARTFAANGDTEAAEEWASRASFLMHAQEFLFTEFTHGEELRSYFRFANYWYLSQLFYMACRVSADPELSRDGYGQSVCRTVAKLYETVYPADDMEFEQMERLCMLHRSIAEDEATGGQDESVIRTHLTRATQYAEKSLGVTAHTLSHPLLYGFEIDGAPSDRTRIVRTLLGELRWDCFAPYRETAWFRALAQRLEECQ